MTKILIIEDEPQHVELIQMRLKRQGMEVIGASNAARGAAAAAEQNPDLILLDLVLPDMSPEKAIKAIRAVSCAARTPIIAFTALDFKEIRRRKLDGKFAGLIQKPYDTAQLLGEIHRVIGKRSEPKVT